MFCGVFGHKPTHGIVPQENLPGQARGAHAPLAVLGPLARSADDLAVAVDILSDYPLKPSSIESLKGLRLFVLSSTPVAKVSKVTTEAIEAAAAKAEAAGAILVRESSLFLAPETFVEDYRNLLSIVMLHGAHKKPDGSAFSVVEFLDILDRQAAVKNKYEEFFEKHDAILMPTFPVQAFPHNDEPDQQKRVLDIDGEHLSYTGNGLGIACLATYAELPSTAIPLGTVNGLPIGMQVICARYKDHDAIKIGKLLAVPT